MANLLECYQDVTGNAVVKCNDGLIRKFNLAMSTPLDAKAIESLAATGVSFSPNVSVFAGSDSASNLTMPIKVNGVVVWQSAESIVKQALSVIDSKPTIPTTPVFTQPVVSARSNWVTGVNTVVPFNFAANPISKNKTVYEPTTGATIKRITDVTQDLTGHEVLYNAYSRYPVENITGEYCIAFAGNSTTSLVINRATGSVVAKLAFDNSGEDGHTIGAAHEVRWHYTPAHPYRVYYVHGTQFWMIDDVRNQSNTRKMIKDFGVLLDWAGTPNSSRKIYGDQEGNSSLDSDHWAWMAVYYDGSNFKVRSYLHYQVSTDTLHTMYPKDLSKFSRIPKGEDTLTVFRARPNMIEMVPDGSGILIHHGRAFVGSADAYIGTVFEAPYIWPRDFNPSTFTPFRVSADATHSGWSSVKGAWYLVQQDNRRDKFMAVPVSGLNKGYGNEGKLDVTLALGAGVIDFHTDGGIYPNVHFGLCTNAADGWTLVSTYTTQTSASHGTGNALYMMKITQEASTIKWHLAPTCNQYPSSNKQDYNESPGSINLAGTRVYTCGDWNGTLPKARRPADPVNGPYSGPTYVDLFSIDLPTNWGNHFTSNPAP